MSFSCGREKEKEREREREGRCGFVLGTVLPFIQYYFLSIGLHHLIQLESRVLVLVGQYWILFLVLV